MAMRIPKESLKKLKKLLFLTRPVRGSTTVASTNGYTPFANGASPIPVKRDTRTYLEKQGWTLTNSSYPATWNGYYRTRVASYRGLIKTMTPPKFYVYKPPAGLTTKHEHKACFHEAPEIGAGWYWIHFSTALNPTPRDLDSGVIKLERILYEAYVLTQKSA
jgi:hypothetical protein